MSCNACSCTDNETEPLKKYCTKSNGGFRFRCSDSCCINCNRPDRFPIKQLNPIGLPIANEPFETDSDSMTRTISISEPVPIIGRPFEQLTYKKPSVLYRILQGVRVAPNTFSIGTFVFLTVVLVCLLLLSTLAIFT